MKWIKLIKYLEMSGETWESVRSKRRNGKWIEGVHWKKAPDGQIYINPAEVDKWVEGCHGALVSGRTSTPRV